MRSTSGFRQPRAYIKEGRHTNVLDEASHDAKRFVMSDRVYLALWPTRETTYCENFVYRKVADPEANETDLQQRS